MKYTRVIGTKTVIDELSEEIRNAFPQLTISDPTIAQRKPLDPPRFGYEELFMILINIPASIAS
jgi:hypothetical protein